MVRKPKLRSQASHNANPLIPRLRRKSLHLVSCSTTAVLVFIALTGSNRGDQPNHSDDGSSQWADGFPHDAWRTLWKPYIAAYKSGASAPVVESEQLIYWYRPHPKDTACTNDGLGPPRGRELVADVVFVSTMLTEPAELTVKSGGRDAVTINVEAGIRTSNFTMGVGQQEFSLSRGGSVVRGGVSDKEISNSCETYNFNPYVGSF